MLSPKTQQLLDELQELIAQRAEIDRKIEALFEYGPSLGSASASLEQPRRRRGRKPKEEAPAVPKRRGRPPRKSIGTATSKISLSTMMQTMRKPLTTCLSLKRNTATSAVAATASRALSPRGSSNARIVWGSRSSWRK